MKNIRRVIAIFCLLILYSYVVNVSNFPSKILVYPNSKLDYKLCPFLNLHGDVEVSSSGSSNSYQMSLNVGNIKLKQVDLRITENLEVVPSRKFNWIKIIY